RRRRDDELHEAGLYARDTRFLGEFTMTLDGEPLQLLDVQTPAPDRAVITRTNPELSHGTDHISPQTILVREMVTLDTALHVAITVRNFSTVALDATLAVTAGSDFLD